jgi:hypothetical protein
MPANIPAPTTLTNATTLGDTHSRMHGRNLKHVENVLAYGCVGDGTTDDRTNFQAAIDACSSAGGGTVFAPGPYTYAIASALNAKSGVSIELAPSATIKLKNSSNVYMITAPTTGAFNDVTIRGGTWDCNGANQTGTASGGLWLVAADAVNGTIDRLRVENVRILNARIHGIFISEGQGGSTGVKVVQNCDIDGHGIGAIGFGIYFDYAPQGVVTGCTVDNGANNSDAFELGHAGNYRCVNNVVKLGNLNYPFADDSVIAFNQLLGSNSYITNDSNTAHRVKIIGNTIKSVTPASNYAGIAVTGDDGIVIGNTISVVSQKGVRINGARATVQGNQIVSTAGSVTGIGVSLETNNGGSRVIGNQISGLFQRGIDCAHSNTVIQGNTISSVMTVGINLTDSSETGWNVTRVSVIGNVIQSPTTTIATNNNSATTSRVIENIGFNPQGTATITVTASPFTYTAGFTPEAVYIRAGTVSDISKQGITLFAATGCTVYLEPAEAVTVTYSSAPTMVKDRK